MQKKTIEVKIQQREPSSSHRKRGNKRDNLGLIAGSEVFSKTGHWNEEENIKYLMFIEFHYDKLKIKENRRLWRIFKIMSDFIKTRRPSQCRSHHKKMETYFQGIPEIIKYYKERIPNYQQHYFKHLKSLQKISFGIQIKATSDELAGQSRASSRDQNREQEDKIQDLLLMEGAQLKRADTVQLGSQQTIKDSAQGKTDLSLRAFPDNNGGKVQNKSPPHPEISFRFPDDQNIGPSNFISFARFPSVYNDLQPQPFYSIGNLMEAYPNFNQYYQAESSNQLDVSEWAECQRLYLVWRGKIQALMREQGSL